MPPYIFRYHNTPSNEVHRSHKYRNRRRKDVYDDPERKYKYDDSLYGDTVYDYESDYTRRTYSQASSKHHYDNGNHSSHYNHHGHFNSNDHNNYNGHLHSNVHNIYGHLHSNDHNNHIGHFHSNGHNTRYLIDPQMKNEYNPHPFVLRELKPTTNRGLHSEPRVYFLDKRLRKDMYTHSHCDCHACPQKSSKTIPTMHYDELRCPHCAAYAQPTQDEVIAYPWTAQSYRPHRRIARTETLPPQKKDTTIPSLVQAPTTSKPQSTVSELQSTHTSTSGSTYISRSEPTDVSRHIPRGRKNDNLTENEISSLGAPPKPLFRQLNSNLTRPGTRTDYSQYSTQSHANKRRSAMSTLREGDADNEDDIKPTDSISNVSLPVLRVQSIDQIPNRKNIRNARADTRVDEDYSREYFRSLGNKPRPLKDTASEISRMIKGEYYDRRNGRTYAYNLSYAPGKIDGTRIAKT